MIRDLKIPYRLKDGRQLGCLTRKLVSEFERNEMSDEMRSFAKLVYGSGKMFEVEPEGGEVVASLRPYAELALRQALGILESTSSRAVKRQRLSATLRLSGF